MSNLFQYQAWAGPGADSLSTTSEAYILQEYVDHIPEPRKVDEGYAWYPPGRSTDSTAYALQGYLDYTMPDPGHYIGEELYGSWEEVLTQPSPDVASLIQGFADYIPDERKVDEGFVWYPPGRSTETVASLLQSYPGWLDPPVLREGDAWYPSGRSTETGAWRFQQYADYLPDPRLRLGESVYTSWSEIITPSAPEIVPLLQRYPGWLEPPVLREGYAWYPPARSTDSNAWSFQVYPDRLPDPRFYEGASIYESWEEVPLPGAPPDGVPLLVKYPDSLPEPVLREGYTWYPPARSTDTQAWGLQAYPDRLPDPVVWEGFVISPLRNLSTETEAWRLQVYPGYLPPPRKVDEGYVVYASWAELISDIVSGPYNVEAMQIYVPGAAAGEVFVPGAAASQVYVPGGDPGEVDV